MVNDLVHFAMERASVIFGGTDKVFNSACFSKAFQQISGVKRVMDGWTVQAMFVGRTDVKPLSGGAHWEVLTCYETPN